MENNNESKNDFYSKEINDLFNIRLNTLNMLKKRNLDIPNNIYNLSIKEFSIQYENKNIDISLNIDNNGITKIYYIYFYNSIQFGKNELKTIVNDILNRYKPDVSNISDINILILLKEKCNIQVNKEINTQAMYQNVKIFHQASLMIDIGNHIFQPNFILLNSEQVKEVLQRYYTNINQLPILKVTDPIAKYYDFKVGDVVKIVPNNAKTGYHPRYRLVK